MAFILNSGESKMEWYPKKASTAFTAGDLVYADGSGAIQPADSTSGDHIGVIQKTITSADSDYASTTLVPVIKAYQDSIFVADVGTGTLTTAMIGNRYDLKDANEIDVTATSKKVVEVVGYISATKALVKINAIIENNAVATT